MGDGGLNSGATSYELPIISYPTIHDPFAQISYESPGVTIGSYTLDESWERQNKFNQFYEISFTSMVTPTLLDLFCLFMFEEGGGVNIIPGKYAPPSWLNGIDTNYSALIVVGGGGYDAVGGTFPDLNYEGCILKSMTLNHAVDSEAGKPTMDLTFVTGYKVKYTNDIDAGDLNSGSAESGWNKTQLGSPNSVNFTGFSGGQTYFSSSADGYEIFPYSYSMSIDRDIQRVGCVDYTNHEPDGYVMQGAMNASMTVVYKRDGNQTNYAGDLSDNSLSTIAVGDDADWEISISGKVSEHGADSGSPELRNSTTVTMAGDLQASGATLTMKM